MTSPALADGAPADAGRRREREGSAATVACADAAGGGGRKGRPGPGAGERADRAAGTARTRPPVRVFGVRHHGPGSSRALAAALEEYRPDCVLVEGPADADGLIGWTGSAEMVPPVALMAWQVDEPSRSVSWPFAVFSPEWQALRWAADHGAQARFMDMPSGVVLAHGAQETERGGAEPAVEPEAGAKPGGAQTGGNRPNAAETGSAEPEGGKTGAAEPEGAGSAGEAEAGSTQARRIDPIAELARVAGYDDPEAWWEDAVELRLDGDPFDALNEGIGLLREAEPETDAHTLRREAYMRRVLRSAVREGHERIAVVCGAWHAPALSGKPPAISADSALLTNLPKAKTSLTWVPWTHQRLSQATGYGAGVASPGWYHHLFTAPDRPAIRWLTRVAQSLRDHDLPVSSAHIIEAARLAEALAVMRGRPMPGLDELDEATLSVLCEGSDLRADLVTREVVVGRALGEVPEGVPMVPLDADLRRTARRLRLAFSAAPKDVTVDLRTPTGLAKAQLLERLTILGVPWGVKRRARSTGTFKEVWTLEWRPEYSVSVVEAAGHGNTVVDAAGAALLTRTDTLADVTRAVESALMAGLEGVLPELLRILDDRAARESDVLHLLASIPALARAHRYGDVRRTDADSLAGVARAVLARACAGLPAAAAGVAEDVAVELKDAVDEVQSVVSLLDEDAVRLWRNALRAALARRGLPGLLAGRITRLLLDGGILTAEQASRRLSRELSSATDPGEQAGWIEGFLAGNALLLIHDPRLLGVIDRWAGGIPSQAFVDALPALRRAFGSWSRAERRELAARVADLPEDPERPGDGTAGQSGRSEAEGGPEGRTEADGPEAAAPEDEDFDFAGPVLETVSAILGGRR